MVIEAATVPKITALLSDIFDIRKEVMLLMNMQFLCCWVASKFTETAKMIKTVSLLCFLLLSGKDLHGSLQPKQNMAISPSLWLNVK